MDQPSKINLSPNPRTEASFLSIVFFWWLNPFLQLGHTKDLELEDFYQVLPEDSSKTLGDQLEREWKKELQNANKGAKDVESKKPSLLRALSRCFAWDFMKPGILAFVEECGVKIIQPVCLAQLLKSLQTDKNDGERWEAYVYGTGIALSTACYIFTHHPYFYTADHVGMKLRVSTCSLLYRKSLKLSKNALGQTTIGQLVNLLSNDVGRFEVMIQYVHFLWVGPLQTTIVVSLLWYELGISGLTGLVLLGFYIAFQGWIGKVFSNMRLKTAKRTDERIRIMNEIISGIRVIKMYAWEKPFASLIEFCRKREVDAIRKTSYYRALDVSFSFSSSKVILFLTLFIFVLTGHALTAEKAFVALLLYEKMRVSMTIFFPNAVSGVAETMVTIKRLENFLMLDEKDVSNKHAERHLVTDCAISLTNATTKWRKNAGEPTLSNVSCTVKTGQLLAVVGPVGAGKTSLLHVLLQELPLTGGGLSVKGKVAYASQEAWVFSGTVRQNILCGESFDPSRYQQIIQVCALEDDLALWPDGDRTYVGEKGVILSGGQKARINLARALYLDADIYLLDDPLSAVDTHVGRHLFYRAIMEFLKNKIRVLVTHQLQYLKAVDQLLILKQGGMEGIGTYEALQGQGIDFANIFPTNGEETEGRKEPFEHINPADIPHRSVRNSPQKDENPADSHQEEIRCKGNVSWKRYYDYFNAGGGCLMLLWLVLLNILTQICFSGSEYWLSIWTSGEERHAKRGHFLQNQTTDTVIEKEKTNNGTFSISDVTIPTNDTFATEGLYIAGRFVQDLDRTVCMQIYAGIVIGLFVFSLLRAVLFFTVCMKASTTLHNKMFGALIRTSVRFFDINPVGRTLNRFSKDVGIMDEMLPATIFDFISMFTRLCGICVVIGLVNPWLLLPWLIIGTACYFFRAYYVNTSRDIKRLEGITRSPVFSHLSASLVGLTTVRAHRAEAIFQLEFDSHQDLHSSAWYLFMTTARWFAMWLDWTCFVYLACVIFGCLVMAETTSSGAGLVMCLAIEMMGLLQWGVRQSAEVENQMTSVERVMDYCELPPEAPLQSAPGIVGRTGAGKSSLIAALFRMTESDGVIWVDGIATKEIGLHDLRSHISIIPQDPVLFTGTLRKNLDPFGQFTDDSLWKVLEDVKLKDVVADLPQGLSYKAAEGGSNFSLGQRQLLCLGRAILRKNRILVLDEATANVDPKTDALIQETIRRQFQDCTVLTIAHRLSTVMDSDRVMVINAGLLQEFDEPNILLDTKSSLFWSLVQETGIEQAHYLTDIAIQAAKKRKNATISKDSKDSREENIPNEPFHANKSEDSTL